MKGRKGETREKGTQDEAKTWEAPKRRCHQKKERKKKKRKKKRQTKQQKKPQKGNPGTLDLCQDASRQGPTQDWRYPRTHEER